jgi:hypothetical protein
VNARSIVFRTAGGTKLWQFSKETPSALEIDGYDADSQEAWSVVARGTTTLVDGQPGSRTSAGRRSSRQP